MHVAERGADLIERLLLQLRLCLHLLAVRICPRHQLPRVSNFHVHSSASRQAPLCMQPVLIGKNTQDKHFGRWCKAG